MNLFPFYDNVLSSQAVGMLQNYANDVDIFRSISQEYLDKNYQSVLVHAVPRGSEIEKLVVHSFLGFNKQYFNYDLSGTFELQLLKYRAGCHYDWHCDYGVHRGEDSVRKLSMTIQLSSAWDYSGCDVIVRDWHNNRHSLSKEVGSITVFDSKTPHKVTPLTNGERLALVAWAHGPELR